MYTNDRSLTPSVDAKVSKTLTTFSEKPLAGLLLRISLTDSSPACVAVHRAMIALSSLLRHGDSIQTQRLKLSAIQALAASARHGISTANAAQHVSAGLILCILEVGDLAAARQSLTSNASPSRSTPIQRALGNGPFT